MTKDEITPGKLYRAKGYTQPDRMLVVMATDEAIAPRGHFYAVCVVALVHAAERGRYSWFPLEGFEPHTEPVTIQP